MDNKRTYYNLCALTGATRGFVGADKLPVLKLRFSTFDKESKQPVSKFYTMFLSKENNERNQQILATLGVQHPPQRCDFDAVGGDMPGLGSRTVDLVCEHNAEGYENVKFVNEPKFGIRVFDMK